MDVNALLSRRKLFLAAWILLLASVFIPAPPGLFPVKDSDMSGIRILVAGGEDLLGGGHGLSASWVIGKTVTLSRGQPDAGSALHFWQVTALTLAFFANTAFFISLLVHNCRRASLAFRIFLIAAVAAGGSVLIFFPVFARLPAYWLWLASLAALAWAFLAFEETGGWWGATSTKGASTGTGDVPLVVWMWLAFIAFWLAVTWIGASRASAPGGTEPKSDIPAAKALASYVNDQAGLIAPDKAANLNVALEKFEKQTSNQIAVAIYARAPLGSIEEFTIATAERWRLGRKGLDNGAILFVFMKERSARLEVGYGLEGVLTDITSHRILEQRLKPAFARDEFAEGLDAALGAIFETVQEAYRQDRMPGKLEVMWRQVVVASPRLLHQALPMLASLDFLPRFLASFFGGVFATIAFYVLREAVRTVFNLGRMARNLVAPRPGGTGLDRGGFGSTPLLEQLKLLGFSLEVIAGSAAFALAAIASVAGIVLIATGGGFGGAGAMVRW